MGRGSVHGRRKRLEKVYEQHMKKKYGARERARAWETVGKILCTVHEKEMGQRNVHGLE